MEDVGKAEKI
jgi:hypothetical protein